MIAIINCNPLICVTIKGQLIYTALIASHATPQSLFIVILKTRNEHKLDLFFWGKILPFYYYKISRG